MHGKTEDQGRSPTLVLLPGLDGTGMLFKSFIAALGSRAKTIVVIYPPDRALGYAELENVARGFLPADEPYYLLAESFSGPIGISIAASAPPNLRGLILCCSFARNPLPWLAFARSLIRFAPMNPPIALLSHFVLGRFRNLAHRAALKDALGHVSPLALRARARAALSVDVSTELEQIEIPILYLRASKDRVVSSACSAWIAALAPHTRIEVVQGPHFLLQVAPVDALATISRWQEAEPHHR
jgi:pimeloyl-ACP methyl ester carboxylesterase